MVALVLAETNRLLSRRMTRFFPLVLAALMIVGIVIAILVISNEDTGGVDFVDDIAAIDESENGVPVMVTEPFVFEDQVFPRPKIFAAVGGVAGLLIAGLYSAFIWNRLSWRAERRTA